MKAKILLPLFLAINLLGCSQTQNSTKVSNRKQLHRISCIGSSVDKGNGEVMTLEPGKIYVILNTKLVKNNTCTNENPGLSNTDGYKLVLNLNIDNSDIKLKNDMTFKHVLGTDYCEYSYYSYELFGSYQEYNLRVQHSKEEVIKDINKYFKISIDDFDFCSDDYVGDVKYQQLDLDYNSLLFQTDYNEFTYEDIVESADKIEGEIQISPQFFKTKL